MLVMDPQLQFKLQQVIQAFQDGNSDGACLILQEALQSDINSTEGIFDLGIAYAKANRFEEAATIFCYLQPYKKNDVRIPYNLGIIYSLQGKHLLAIESYDLALKIQPDDIEVLVNKGSTCNDIKNYLLALEVLEKAVELRPDIPEAWSNKGIALNNLSLYLESINAYNEAIKLNPNYYEAWSNKSVPLNKLKRFLEALEACDVALNLNSNYAEGWANKGVTLKELKRYEDALAHFDQALSFKSDFAEAWFNKGITLHELRRYEEALVQFDEALRIMPSYAEAWSNKGVTLHELKRYEEALVQFDEALRIMPNYAEAWSNKGVTLHELKRYEEALLSYDKALSLKSDYPDAWSNKGNTLNELNLYSEAIAHYDQALNLKPDYAEAWSNKGVTLHELKRYEEAIFHYDKALSLKPDYPEGWSNKGITLHELKRYDEAIAHYDKALSLKSDINWVYGDLTHTKMKICHWTGLADDLKSVSQELELNQKVINPFPLLALNDDALLHKKSSEIYVQNKYPFNDSLGPCLQHSKKQKIRIGYFSADFRDHAVSILTAELFELHDKNNFEIFAFSFGADDKSAIRLRLTKAFNQFINVRDMSDLDIAKLSRDLSIDIAVDLGGHTADSRTGIFSYRAAPIQASYIGYLGTMGAEYFDYLLADKTIVPEELQQYYSEKIIYLPSYQVNDRKRIISDRVFTRKELGLPAKGFVYCCFNNNYKILPDTFSGWMRILKAIEGSVLFLYAENKWAEENLRKEAEARGVDSARLIFGGHLTTDEYLARYQCCDLFLDTFPYNAGTTASDALWAGLPVLTRMGQSFASRMAASLLNAIDLPEMITDNQEEYEALAIELAKNPRRLADIKSKLANNRLTAPLFDTPLFTKNLEAAYIKMYERNKADLQPDHIIIS